MSAVDVERQAQRALTQKFIAADPEPIALTPRQRTVQPGGSYKLLDLTPRPLQIFKFIQELVDGTVEGSEGQARIYRYTLLGEWNASVAVGDWWVAGSPPVKYEVLSLYPYNGYEVRAAVQAYGADPEEGSNA